MKMPFPHNPRRFFISLLSYAGLALVLILGINALAPEKAQTIFAQSIEELQDKIDTTTSSIKALEAEIRKYQSQITTLGSQANTLQNTIKTLDAQKKKLQAELAVTKDKINVTSGQISDLNKDIRNQEAQIEKNYDSVGVSLNNIYKRGSDSIIESLLASVSTSEFVSEIDTLSRLQVGVRDRIEILAEHKRRLEQTKTKVETKKKELLNYTEDLSDQQKLIVTTTNEKSSLLSQTKNEEANYKKLLAEKVAQKAQFERELFEAESALRIAVDPNSIPSSAKGVLKWPLDRVVITQYFGNTSFATQNPQIYNGKGHTGIDLGTPTGTKVKAAMSGVVAGMGNTDEIRGCYSYGKWILLKHPNGLSTLYAHLSLQSVSVGDSVTTGQVIGYSGNTGYSTGPHLHFTVYATQGVRVMNFANSINCKGALIPLADPSAYLNPLSFL